MDRQLKHELLDRVHDIEIDKLINLDMEYRKIAYEIRKQEAYIKTLEWNDHLKSLASKS